jgi:DNA-directed RNA polymerase beta' subunit
MELSILPKMQPPDPPLAELVGIQFGMLAAKEIINFSVLEKGKSVRTPKELWDPRLGQPVEDRCATCGGRNTDECTGMMMMLKSFVQDKRHEHGIFDLLFVVWYIQE